MKKQAEFNLQKGSWGGRRINSGRKRTKSEGVSHRTREKVSAKTPLHINFKLSIPLRNASGIRALRRSVDNSRNFVNVLHYSLESNHIHLIIEAENNLQLEKGMRSFTNTFVKSLGKGTLQKERYHLHVLRTPAEVENAFRYVLLNHLKHTGKNSISADLFSSLHTLVINEVSKKFKVTVVKTKIKNEIELDQPSSWLAKQALTPDKR